MYHYLACFDAISIGCLTAIFYSKIEKIKYAQLYQFIFLIIMVVTFIIGIKDNKIFGFLFISLSTSGLIFVSKNTNKDWIQKNKFTQLICKFGRYSYEIYLFHIIILGIFRDEVKPEQLNIFLKIFSLILFIAVSYFISKFISEFYSEKINKLIRLRFKK